MFVTTLLHFVKHFISKTRNYVRNCSQTPFPLITTDRFSMLLPKLTFCVLASILSHPHEDITPTNSFISLLHDQFLSSCFSLLCRNPPTKQKRKEKKSAKTNLDFISPTGCQPHFLVPFIASFSKEFLIFPSSVLVLIFLLLNRKMYVL